MKFEILKIKTKKFFDVIDITEKVQNFLKKIKARTGLLNIFTKHTTVSIKINENEKGFHADLEQILSQNIANKYRSYFHNDLHIRDPQTFCSIAAKECLNGHSHIMQMFLGSASETVPVQDGGMMLGNWQKILMFELDHSKEREIILSFLSQE